VTEFDAEFDADLTALHGLVGAAGVVILSGAGLSTESGIPDYRGPSGATRRYAPMTYQLFVSDAAARQRYWARSHLGWGQLFNARPNAGHRAVAALQSRGLVDGIITQNVDGLHQAAGAGGAGVIELHGGLSQIVCLTCGVPEARADLGRRLTAANPDFDAEVLAINPDGDAELPDAALAQFQVVGCWTCGSELIKPDVVFFGENVPRHRVDACYALVDAARSLLVLGSSLTVLSGLRFVRRAAASGTPIAIVNQGPTRGDEFACVRVDAPLGAALTQLAQAMDASRRSA
jgi:NAD-dependent SIR2 family protein deacetylase